MSSAAIFFIGLWVGSTMTFFIVALTMSAKMCDEDKNESRKS
jgi:hypothetical protein